jgi:hypothetical protein
VARTRTTKKLAQRIDLNYFKRPTPLKRAKLWLSLLLPLLALVWIAWRGLSGDHRVYSSGRMSKAHSVLEKECAACHVQQAGAFSARAAGVACLACHDGPMHHAAKIAAAECASCHTEHRGRINISATSNQVCSECHSDLHAAASTSSYASRIRSFEEDHPQFVALRPVAGVPARDPGTIKLNHAIHMKPIRRGPTGPIVNLECGNCHRPTSVGADLTYADAKYRAAAVSYKESDEVLPIRAETLRPPKPVSGRELMAPVKFANACAACHLLTFDERFEEGVPHDKPEVVHAFVVKKFQQYIAAHPAEARVRRDPNRDLTGKPLVPEVRVLTPAQWVAERTAEAEELLWRKTCKQCHALDATDGDPAMRNPGFVPAGAATSGSENALSAPPYIQPARVTLRWLPHAKFNHDAHRGFTCVSCHQKALTSTETRDILIPGMETCKTCHAPGLDHAESRCFECHIYHDWSKRKEVTPKFTLPALRIGSR